MNIDYYKTLLEQDTVFASPSATPDTSQQQFDLQQPAREDSKQVQNLQITPGTPEAKEMISKASINYLKANNFKVGDIIDNYTIRGEKQKVQIIALPGETANIQGKQISVPSGSIVGVDPQFYSKYSTSQQLTTQQESLARIYTRDIVLEAVNQPTILPAINSQGFISIGPRAGQSIQQSDLADYPDQQTKPDEIQRTDQEAASESPIDQNTKKQLESPNSTFDLDKKYYLNITKAGGRTFDWKKLTDKELRATFMSSKNITKAASDLENYAAKLTPPQQESLFNRMINNILSEATVQPSYTISGIGEVNGTTLVQATVQAVLENVKNGADISKIQNKIRVTETAFNTLKDKVQENIIDISKFNMLIPNLLTLTRGTVKAGGTSLSDSSTVLKNLQQGLISGFKLPGVKNLNTFKSQFKKLIAPDILNKLKSVPEIKTQIDNFTKTGKKEADLHAFITQSYGQLIESIIGQGAQKQVNIKGSQEIHNIIFELFCKPPDNYILYLTEEEWNDISQGGKVVGTILGVLTGLAKSF